jgi:hypothetical protein
MGRPPPADPRVRWGASPRQATGRGAPPAAPTGPQQSTQARASASRQEEVEAYLRRQDTVWAGERAGVR